MRFGPSAVLFIFIFLFFVSIPSCGRKPASLEALDYIDRRTNVPMVEPVSRDLAQIRERGSITVVAPYNSTTYFIYQGEPLGYEYELLAAFAKDLGVALKIVVVTDPKSLLPALNEGEGDIAAAVAPTMAALPGTPFFACLTAGFAAVGSGPMTVATRAKHASTPFQVDEKGEANRPEQDEAHDQKGDPGGLRDVVQSFHQAARHGGAPSFGR